MPTGNQNSTHMGESYFGIQMASNYSKNETFTVISNGSVVIPKNDKLCPGSSPGQVHCVVFLEKTLNSHSASLHPGL